jgi:putative ABC transport system permease protein
VEYVSKLRLVQIQKSYPTGNTKVEVLKGISLDFRENEFVSILGQSGSGKTTLLNIIGGLDRYDSGDLIINEQSTKKFKDSDWDAYRNKSIGFVFQNYNLIGHQSVLQNVEIAMTLSGVSSSERKQRAIEVLHEVGLEDHIYKKPSQLSGGQMQRVAIARALVNNPDSILADEPTGALDSQTSIQVMDLLKKISETRLVIMVTHNEKIADKYSSRIIRFLDGEVKSDSHPIVQAQNSDLEPQPEQEKHNKTSMSFWTATMLSFRNLMTKKGRSLITSFAGSIGIIGVALVLALSNGMSQQIEDMQYDTLSSFPISITTDEQRVDFNHMQMITDKDNSKGLEEFPEESVLYRFDRNANVKSHKNILTKEYLDYIGQLETELPGTVNAITYARGVDINLLAKGESTVVNFMPPQDEDRRNRIEGMDNQYWQEMPDDEEFILSLYDVIGDGSRLPREQNEIAIVVDEYNRIDKSFFEKLGITSETEKYNLDDFIGKKIVKVIPNNDYYTKNENDVFVAANPAEYDDLFKSNSGLELMITGILRIKEDAASSYFSEGFIYITELTNYLVLDAQQSEIAKAQEQSDVDVVTNIPFPNDDWKEQALIRLGVITTPTGINISPIDFSSKDEIKEYLNAYNKDKKEKDQIIYTDLAETITGAIGGVIDTVTYVLIGFAAISLLVSTIMIGIITYVSVIERTKEIGILRSVGARKRDISRVFNAETLIIGFVAGALGIGLSYLFIIPINKVIFHLTDIQGVANLNILSAFILIIGSMVLTLIAGLIPARMAAKKDPVRALRTE